MGNNYKFDKIGTGVKLTAPSGESMILRGEEASMFLEEVGEIEDNFYLIHDFALESSGKDVSFNELLDKIIACYF